MPGPRPRRVLTLVTLGCLWTHAALAQSPTIDPGAARGAPEASSLGPSPGDSGTSANAPADSGSPLGGRIGTAVPRAPAAVTRPGQEVFGIPDRRGITVPEPLPLAEVPIYGPLALPSGPEDEGPADGLTLDAAIARLLAENLDLRAQNWEIPQAEADILTASLRANPVLYADGQLIPYGTFSEKRPGGATQYDLNVSYPLDLSRKRRSRMEVAARARGVLQAQFQDAVRLQIDNLYTAFVDVLAARETVRYARSSAEGLETVLARVRRQFEVGEKTRGEVSRFEVQRDAARIGLADADEAYRRAKRQLAPLLRLPPAEAAALEPRGTIRDTAPAQLSPDALIATALAERPDLAAFRLGIGRAQADVRLAQAERFQDVYVLFQPYTFQDNQPFNTKSAHSWALGVTVPLPINNRNQGNILRARHNVSQTRTELEALELRVVTEVAQAEREYSVSRDAVDRVERGLLPAAARVVQESLRQWNLGEASLVDYLNARRDYNEIVRQYRDTAIRHRRSMLALNTAVGRRILP